MRRWDCSKKDLLLAFIFMALLRRKKLLVGDEVSPFLSSEQERDSLAFMTGYYFIFNPVAAPIELFQSFIASGDILAAKAGKTSFSRTFFASSMSLG